VRWRLSSSGAHQATDEADTLLCNSLFTASVIRKTFPEIRKDIEVVYPGIDAKQYLLPLDGSEHDATLEWVLFLELKWV
jgi:hypothetical protein